MSAETLGSLALALLLLIAGANLFGQLAAMLRQPRVVGEILAGILLGPSLFELMAPGIAAQVFGDGDKSPSAVVLGFFYHLGLLLLMFVSGASVRNVLGKENRKPTAWILSLGTPLPFFLALAVAPLLPLEAFMGDAGSKPAVILVFAIAAAVTSIPVITKIFYDLGILHTRFASLMLGAAVLEDIVLWGVLALATAIATATVAAAGGALAETVSVHVVANGLYVLLAMTVLPLVLRRLSRARWNIIATHTPIAWIMIVLLGYVSVAAVFDVTLAFAAFLAGFGIVGGMKSTEHQRFQVPLDSISHVSGAVFIPIYFAIVGYRLDFTKGFSPLMLIGFLLGSSVVVLLSVGLAARLAGFRRLDIINLAVTCNARGGPGIVLASVAFDAAIINAPFFTTLVLTAVLTSQACGVWLAFVLRRGWPLLSSEGPVEQHKPATAMAGELNRAA
ncbi:cation:proton antiporter [Actinomadura sp. 6N118]|uniref:cation:proton antiporter n=1 Tax=Actinomadura sp. 6N118 TaxID=3375151 RepID=UPI0037A8EE49